MNSDLPLMSVCLVLKEKGWILEKMATRLLENLSHWNIYAEISDLPSSSADINHWMVYYDLEGETFSRTTLAITHVDRPAKLHVLKQRLKKADLGICMSRMTLEQLVRSGVPRSKLCYILPAYDGDVVPSRIVVGLTTQIRPDGAKREDILINVARSMRLDMFHFSIIGPRWEKIIPILEASGATVDYISGAQDNVSHRKLLLERLEEFDYYLYMGWDEGSMGMLDALAAGIPTIVTPQGFHLDIGDGITYPFHNAPQLLEIFKQLSNERQKRIDSVSGLTWDRYAYQHAVVWRNLLENNATDGIENIHSSEKYVLSMDEISSEIKKIGKPIFFTRNTPSTVLGDVFTLLQFYSRGNFKGSWFYRIGKWVKSFFVRNNR